MGVGILGSVRFGLFEGGKKRIAEQKGVHLSKLDLADKSAAALFAGFFNSFILVRLPNNIVSYRTHKN